jgi:FMN phosphatase YigB (HAD superfamily)
MVKIGPERVLVVGDSQRNLQGALTPAMPGAQVTSVPDYFEAIAELAGINTRRCWRRRSR